jgi:predicted metal-dependent hydrolase
MKELNKFHNFPYSRIFIRSQTTRWASCSKKGNLSFNYKIIFLPETLMDYVIIHELCHLKEFNHSKRFWTLVESHVPDYMAKRHDLKKYSLCP